jgi:CubicO group peptidase (beta-lactamase class C family)
VDARRIEGVLERHGRKHVGLAVGVRVGDEIRTIGRGRVDAGRPDAPAADTIFEIGSITKVFTAIVLADMVEEGLVALDDPVTGYLPAGLAPPVRGRPITLRDLATHSSGLPRLPKGLLRLALRERSNPYRGFTHEHLERAIVRTRPRRAPGRRVRYSNYGFGLLGHVLALRVGTTYEELVRERVCRPPASSTRRSPSTPPLSHASRRVTTAAGGPSRTGTFRRSPVRVPSARPSPIC